MKTKKQLLSEIKNLNLAIEAIDNNNTKPIGFLYEILEAKVSELNELENSNKTYFISIDGYVHDSGVYEVGAKILREALIEIHSKYQYPLDFHFEQNEIDEMENCDLINLINKNDGCDYILSIIEKGGEIIYQP